MLTSLFISNYALIDRIEIEFGSGLNIVTGETGAGKSIVLGALGLLIGDRAESRIISDKSRKTIVEATFNVTAYPLFNSFLQQQEVDIDAETCILRREVSIKGTSRAFINDTPVNLATMKLVARRLLDIHTQHENLLLASSDFQLEVVDSLADNAQLRKKYSEEFSAYKKTLKKYSVFKKSLEKSKEESEYNTYLLQQLDELNLQEGEQEYLERERDIVSNATQIKSGLTAALNGLVRSDEDVLSQLSKAKTEIEHLSSFIADSESLTSRLESARLEIADIAETLLEYDRKISTTDKDIDAIEDRLNKIYTLQGRHNVSSDVELINIRKALQKSLNEAENGEEVLLQLENEAKKAKKAVVLTARELTRSRQEAAIRFAEDLREKVCTLGLDNLRCEISIKQDKLTESGADVVEFLFAFNKNQELMPVGKTASGGEIARVILAIKSILVDKMQLPTIIFDEVDTGVSGDIANRMARLMLQIAESTQVITITHIAAVAAHGARHYKVYKQDVEDVTNTYIKLLDIKERRHELAAMISGDPDDEKALETATVLLSKNNN